MCDVVLLQPGALPSLSSQTQKEKPRPQCEITCPVPPNSSEAELGDALSPPPLWHPHAPDMSQSFHQHALLGCGCSGPPHGHALFPCGPDFASWPRTVQRVSFSVGESCTYLPPTVSLSLLQSGHRPPSRPLPMSPGFRVAKVRTKEIPGRQSGRKQGLVTSWLVWEPRRKTGFLMHFVFWVRMAPVSPSMERQKLGNGPPVPEPHCYVYNL